MPDHTHKREIPCSSGRFSWRADPKTDLTSYRNAIKSLIDEAEKEGDPSASLDCVKGGKEK
jgi:hypothetical protein